MRRTQRPPQAHAQIGDDKLDTTFSKTKTHSEKRNAFVRRRNAEKTNEKQKRPRKAQDESRSTGGGTRRENTKFEGRRKTQSENEGRKAKTEDPKAKTKEQNKRVAKRQTRKDENRRGRAPGEQKQTPGQLPSLLPFDFEDFFDLEDFPPAGATLEAVGGRRTEDQRHSQDQNSEKREPDCEKRKSNSERRKPTAERARRRTKRARRRTKRARRRTKRARRKRNAQNKNETHKTKTKRERRRTKTQTNHEKRKTKDERRAPRMKDVRRGRKTQVEAEKRKYQTKYANSGWTMQTTDGRHQAKIKDKSARAKPKTQNEKSKRRRRSTTKGTAAAEPKQTTMTANNLVSRSKPLPAPRQINYPPGHLAERTDAEALGVQHPAWPLLLLLSCRSNPARRT